jgi:hypothetical protein
VTPVHGPIPLDYALVLPDTLFLLVFFVAAQSSHVRGRAVVFAVPGVTTSLIFRVEFLPNCVHLKLTRVAIRSSKVLCFRRCTRARNWVWVVYM